MKSDKKKEFVAQFNPVSKYEGGTMYNKIINSVRKGLTMYDTGLELLEYAEDRGIETLRILRANRELFIEAYNYAKWFEEQPKERQKAIKHREKMRHFKEARNGKTEMG